jgi:DNA-binding transcriptional LysR family regulator
MLKLDGIEALLATVDGGSLSAAALRLKLSRSVVSDRLAELERELGVRLMHRTTRKLSLTEDGEVFLPRARALSADIASAIDELAHRQGSLAGRLRIAAPTSFGTMHLGPSLYPFLAKHPSLELVLELDDRHIDLASEGYDLAIRVGQPTDTRLVIKPLVKSRRVLVASRSYLQRYGTPSTINDLTRHTAIAYSIRGSADWRFVHDGEVSTVRPHKASLLVNNGEAMRDAAVAGLGLALMPTFIVAPAVLARALVIVELDGVAETDQVYAAFVPGAQKTARARELIAHLQQSFGDPPYWDERLF